MKHLLLVVLVSFGMAVQAQLKTYPVGLHTGMPHNDDYTVRVRMLGGEWQDVFEYKVQVDLDKPQDASMVQFDMGSPVEVMVKKNNGTVREVAIRPLNNNIACRQVQNAVFFTLDKPQNLSIEFNGDRLHNLHLFANPMEEEVYSEEAEGVMFFGPGIHRPKDLPNNQIRIPSNTTVYLAPGAVLKAKLLVDNAENVRIIGRGILDHPVRGIEITDAKNVLIDGITVVNSRHYTVSGGQSQGITIKNLKSFSYQGWSDGLDFMSCSDVVIDDVFLRNSDDCIAIYTHRWNYYGDSRNIRVLNSTLWADIAHPINVGTHGNTKTGDEVLEDILFKNIDILEHDEDDRDYQGCMTINVGDHNLAQNITFEDIRVEHIQEGQLFHLRVMYNQKYNTGPGRGVKNITFRNISCTGKYINSSLIEGYDKNRKIENVLFENIVLNGKRITSLKELNIDKKDFVEKIRIK